jgi:hypothetical protein
MVLRQEIVVNCSPVIYRTDKLIAVGKYICPVPHFTGNGSTKWSLRQHFHDCHPQDCVVILSKGQPHPPKMQKMWNADGARSPL